jgi:inosose dehydratase
VAREFVVGHTGITWGYTIDRVEQTIKDIAELGYHAYETFGFTIEEYEQKQPGQFAALLERYGIPMASCYCNTRFVEPAQARDDIEQVMRWAQLAKSFGAKAIVLQAAGQRTPQPYAHYKAMAAAFSEIGRRVQDMGMIAAIHPHTGTLIETRAEIDAVLGALEPGAAFFAPDTGQIVKGGSDLLQVLRDYGSLVRHVHLKDYVGGPVRYDAQGKEIDTTGYANYVPIGYGAVDMPAVFRFFEEINYNDLVMVELDGTPNAPRPPREAAEMSKRYLRDTLGQKFA